MKIFKKLPIFIIIFVLIFGVQFIKPKKANAFLGIADVDVGAMMTAAKEYGIDTLVTILNNRILNKLIDDTVNWAAGGFDGDPGYINNWDGFLEGVKHDAISTALYTATKEAYKAQNKTNNLSDDEKRQCLTDANEEYQTYLANIRYNDAIDACDTLDGDEYEECVNNAEGELIPYEEILEALPSSTEIENIFQDAKNSCNGISGGNTYEDIGNIAFENWNNYENTGVINARSVASSIANYGAKKLNENTLNALIKGEGNTINYLLGSKENVDNFKNEFRYGGWTGYMALADPHNSQIGRESMIKKVLSLQTGGEPSKVDKAVQDLQTKKYEGKKKCVEWEKSSKEDAEIDEMMNNIIDDKSGTKKDRKCLRYETVTPGSLVESSMKEIMSSDQKSSRMARELSDVLAKALGKLTNKLIQVGVDKLKERRNSGNSATENLDNMVNNAFNSNYQNEYDVLGIADDARIFNNGGEENENGTTTEGDNTTNTENNSDYKKPTGGDASVPYVGGPEDLIGLNWNEGPELIVELKGDLEKSLTLTKQYLDLNIEISNKLKSSKENVAILDYCRPGPDFNWEKRYNDKANFIIGLFKQKKEDDDSCGDFKYETNEKLFDIGLPLIKEMNNDPSLNIPGANDITDIIDEVAGDKNKELIKTNKDAKQEKRIMYNVLKRIRLEAETNLNFKKQINVIDNKITLFSDKIYKKTINEDKNGKEIITKVNILTDDDLKKILNIKVILDKKSGDLIGLDKGNNKSNAHIDEKGNILKDSGSIQFDSENMTEEYLIEYRNLYSFKDQVENNLTETQESDVTIETPETLISKNREKAEQLIIDLGWDIWRRTVDKDTKSKLRYQYYTLKNNLVTEQDILKLKIDSKNARENSAKIADYVLDCISFLKITNKKSDSEIKDYLESEYNKQQNNDQNNTSVFKTNLYTSPTNIQTSILRFVNNEDGETFDDYIKKVYPDRYKTAVNIQTGGSTVKKYHGIGRTINQILELDKTGRTVMLNMNETIFDKNKTNLAIFQAVFFASPGKLLKDLFDGPNKEFDPNEGKELFCFDHTDDDFDPDGCVSGLKDYLICESEDGGSGTNKWKPAQRWYFGKKITYSALFAGI